MHGQAGSWSGYKEQSFMSTGESHSVDSNPRLSPSSSSATSSDLTRATEPRDAHPLRSSGETSESNVISRSDVSHSETGHSNRVSTARRSSSGPPPFAPAANRTGGPRSSYPPPRNHDNSDTFHGPFGGWIKGSAPCGISRIITNNATQWHVNIFVKLDNLG